MSENQSGIRVQCLITGRYSYFSKDVLERKIKQFGSYERAINSYICRDASNLLKEGKSQEAVRTELGLDNTEYVRSDDDFIDEILSIKRSRATSNEPRITYDFKVEPGWDRKPIDISEVTKETCLLPNIYLDDCCENCRYFNQCTLPSKKIRKKIQKS